MASVPHSLDPERAVVAACLLDPASIALVVDLLSADDFTVPTLAKTYAAVVALFGRGEGVDMVTVGEELTKRGELNAVGGLVGLTDITTDFVSSVNVEQHARYVCERSSVRSLQRAAESIITRSREVGIDSFDLMDYAGEAVFSAGKRLFKSAPVSSAQLATRVWERLQSAVGSVGGITGIASGLDELDRITAGFQNSDLIIVAARPSMGKTALALDFARNAACPAGLFSLEMSGDQLGIRMVCSIARVDMARARSGLLDDAEMQSVGVAASAFAAKKLSIDDTGALTVLELRAKARRMVSDNGVGLIIIDYLQLMSAPHAESREREISQISRSLKQLAKELNVPVICLSQLNRQVEGRADKRPMLSDLRESGAIEQDADVVMFVHRPEYYGQDSIEIHGTPTSSAGVAEIIVAKQRNGPTGSAFVTFEKQFASFTNMNLNFSHF